MAATRKRRLIARFFGLELLPVEMSWQLHRRLEVAKQRRCGL